MTAAEVANLAVRISLEDKLTGGIAKMTRTLGKFDANAGRTAKGVKQLGGGLLKVGVIAGAAVATGLGVATRIALNFDDAFAGVAKTVEGSAPELQKLNDQLHALATRIPVNYTDLAGIAAEAGALGVAKNDIAGFTETVARLSASTQGLTTEAAAEAFGKFKNSLGLTEKQIEQSASALIALGNAGASSEGDIIEIGKRFAGAGRTAGLSAAQVLGLSSAIASVGVQPEAAGGSLSRLFNNINKYIGTGDKKLQAFAKTSGQTVAQFKKGFEKDALGSFEQFLKGLSTLSGPEQAKRLKEAGVNNVRDISALQLLAHSYGEVKRQTDLSTAAFKKNTALTEVSTKRFDTFKNKLTVLGNNFKEAGYDIASGFLPALGRAADKLTAFLQKPENVKLLKSIGVDLGHALDKVNFDKLLGVAKGLASALDPALKIVLKIGELIAKLPPQVIGAGGAFIIGDKVTGGALSGGIGNILGGLGGSIAKSLAAQIPVFGKAFVQPVFVTNPGFGGGGIPGLPGGAADAAGGAAAKLGATAGAGIVITDMHQFNSDIADRLEHSGTKFGADAGAAFREQANKTTLWDNILQGLGLQAPKTHERLGPPAPPLGPGSRDMDKNLATAAQALTALKTHGINLQAIAGARLLALGVTEKSVNGSIHTLKEKLSAVVKQEGAAQRAGDSRHAAALASKEAAIRGQLSAANAKLQAIRAKKTAVNVKTNVSVSQTVSVSSITKGTKVRSQYARSTGFDAGANIW